MTNTMGGTHLHTPPSIFQHMMVQQGTSQQVSSWSQIPQVPPLSIPWSVSGVQQPELIRFTGEQSFAHRQKRKLETPDLLNTRKTKQLITEEKMAAHFQDLHISSTYHSPPDPVPSTSATNKSLEKPNVGMDMETTNLVDADHSKSPRLVLSEELKRLQQEPILPTTLLSKLERPSMALILWEPPSKHLRILPTRDTPTPIPSVSDDNNNNNNNSENIPDLNQITSFEPMEL